MLDFPDPNEEEKQQCNNCDGDSNNEEPTVEFDGEIWKGEPISKILNEQFYFTRAPGAWILSDKCDKKGNPILQGKIPSFQDKKAGWLLLKEKGYVNQLVHVFYREEDLTKHIQQCKQIIEQLKKRKG